MTRFDLGNKTLIFMANFKPSVVVSGRVKDVLPIVDLFPTLINIDVEATNKKWRQLPNTPAVVELIDNEIETFWYSVGELKNCKNDLMFHNISKLAKLYYVYHKAQQTLKKKFPNTTSKPHAKDLLKCFDNGEPISSEHFIPPTEMLFVKIIYEH